MKILVDKMPASGKECIFKGNHSVIDGCFTCGFHTTRVCSLDCGKECKYLSELILSLNNEILERSGEHV